MWGAYGRFAISPSAEHLKRELEHQALHDALTGLANQALFRDRVDHAAARLHRHELHLAVLFVDLDNFKNINDTLGHSAGDALLAEISERLTGLLRPTDTAARLGGDEFAILVDDLIDRGEADRDRTPYPRRRPGPGNHRGERTDAHREHRNRVSASAGPTPTSCCATPTSRCTPRKRAERTATASSNPTCTPPRSIDSTSKLAFASGSADGEFVLHYQPIYDLRSGRIPAVEALVRWNHPERGLLAPEAFIPFADQTNLINDLGDQILDTACQQAGEWADTLGETAPAIAVNLSPQQLHNPNVAEHVAEVLARHGIRPVDLIFEITEGALMTDPERAAATLEQLHQMGVRLAVDDFGTGYSSLSYLQRFPIDILKIDRAFTREMVTNSKEPLTRAIIQLAHTLHLTPVAEGIENQAQADTLRAYGCHLAQGFHLGRPLDSRQTSDLLHARTTPRNALSRRA